MTFQSLDSLGIILRSVIINTHVQFFPVKINFCLCMVWLFPARTVLSSEMRGGLSLKEIICFLLDQRFSSSLFTFISQIYLK